MTGIRVLNQRQVHWTGRFGNGRLNIYFWLEQDEFKKVKPINSFVLM